MARGWRLNPPPNWPALPTDWRPADGWRPDPGWGPAPVGWTLWQRERRTAWLRRHKTAFFLGAGSLVIVGSAIAGPAATELVTADGPPAAGTPVDDPGGPRAAVPAPVGDEDVRSEPQVEPPVRRPQESPRASRALPRPSDDPTSAAVPTPSALPVLPVPAEPVPQLQAEPEPSRSCEPDERNWQWPGDDRDEQQDHPGRQVVLVAAHEDLDQQAQRDGRDDRHPDASPCPTSSGDAPPG